MAPRQPPPRPANGLERVLEILTEVASGSRPTHGEVASLLDAPKGTTSKLLARLSDLGYLRVEDRRYDVGPALMALGYNLRLHDRFGAAAKPILEHITSSSGESSLLVVEVGQTENTAGHIVAVEHVESHHPVRYIAEPGTPRPIHSTAAGRVILAHTGRSTEHLPDRSVIEDAASFDHDLEKIRKQGYSIRTADGVTTLAAPVRGPGEQSVAAISIVGLTARMGQPEEHLWPLLQEAVWDSGLAVARG